MGQIRPNGHPPQEQIRITDNRIQSGDPMASGQVRCLVTGATGYIGSRLVPKLLNEGHWVRALARNPSKLADVPWRERVEVAQGDLGDVESLEAAFDGVEVVY